MLFVCFVFSGVGLDVFWALRFVLMYFGRWYLVCVFYFCVLSTCLCVFECAFARFFVCLCVCFEYVFACVFDFVFACVRVRVCVCVGVCGLVLVRRFRSFVYV